MVVDTRDMEKIARELALSNAEADPGITRIIWFPADEEVRLIEVHTEVAAGDPIMPFHFPPAESLGVPLPCAIALVSDSDIGSTLPAGWGSWAGGVDIFSRPAS